MPLLTETGNFTIAYAHSAKIAKILNQVLSSFVPSKLACSGKKDDKTYPGIVRTNLKGFQALARNRLRANFCCSM